MTVNYLAIIVSVIASIAIGFIWYGPLFGKQWMALMGWTPEKIEEGKKKGMTKQIIIQIIASFVMAFVLAHAILDIRMEHGYTGVYLGLFAAFWNWLGFIATVTVGMVLWEGKSWKLWSILNGCWLVTLAVMGVILALW